MIYKYLTYYGYFSKDSERDYSSILSKEDLLNRLEILWEKYYKDHNWGTCNYYFPHKQSFHDQAGPLGNLAYMLWYLRKELNYFNDFSAEFEFDDF